MAVLHTPLHLWFSAKRRHKPNALLMHTNMLLETRGKENHCGRHYCEACVHQEGEHDLWNFVAPENGSVCVSASCGQVMGFKCFSPVPGKLSQ